MTRSIRLALTLAMPLALLAACGDDAEVSTEDDGREASGEVLDGSISDEMLPIDQVQSQAPQRAPDPEEAGSSSGETAPAAAAESAPEEPAAAPAEAEPAE